METVLFSSQKSSLIQTIQYHLLYLKTRGWAWYSFRLNVRDAQVLLPVLTIKVLSPYFDIMVIEYLGVLQGRLFILNSRTQMLT